MGLTDKELDRIIKNKGREEFFQERRDIEINNYKSSFETNYAKIKKVVERTNKFLDLLFDIAEITEEFEPFTYNEFCQSLLKYAEIHVEKIDFSLLIMDDEVRDSYSRREFRKDPTIRNRMSPEAFQKHIQKQIPKWSQERIARLKVEEILVFHRNIIFDVVMQKIEAPKRRDIFVKENVLSFAEEIFPEKETENVKFNIRN